MNHLRTIWPFITTLVLAALLLFFLAPRQASAPETKPSLDPEAVLTPEAAAQIAADRYPDGQIQSIVLMEAHERAGYLITLDTPDQGLLQLHIQPDGEITQAQPVAKPAPSAMPMKALAQKLQDDYPAALLLSLKLSSQEGLPIYRAELAQDDQLISIYGQATDGQILEQRQNYGVTLTLPADTPDFHHLLEQALAFPTDAVLSALTIDTKSGEYTAVYSSEGYSYSALFDQEGRLLADSLKPLAPQQPAADADVATEWLFPLE